MNFGWTKGDHNVKFGGEMKLLHQNHYETQTPTFTFIGRPHGARAGRRRTTSTRLRISCWAK